MENKEFYIDFDGFKLHAKLDCPKTIQEKKPLVILVPGLTGHMEEEHILGIKDVINEVGFFVLRVELYGHGKTDGAFKNHNLYEWVSELYYIVDYAKQLDYVSDVYLAGHSQGGLATILVAGLKRKQLKAILPLSPALNIPVDCRKGDFFGTLFDPLNVPDEICFWEENYVSGNYVRIAQMLPVEQAIAQYDGPVLLIHGTNDSAVPYFYSLDADRKYKDANLVLIDGAEHCYENHLEFAKKAVKDFLNQINR